MNNPWAGIERGPNVTNSQDKPKVFLFLQGPRGRFFSEMAAELERRGGTALRINLCAGDALFWPRPGAVNYRGTLSEWPAFVGSFMDRHRVTDIVLLGEQRPVHRAAIAEAKVRGVAVTVTDFGYLRPDWITFERDGMSGLSRFPRSPDAISALARQVPEPDLKYLYQDSFWRLAALDMLYHLSSSLLWMLYPNYRSHLPFHPISIYLGLGSRMALRPLRERKATAVIDRLQAGRTDYYVFPLQVHGDYQIRAYSPYADLRVAIDEIVQSFARNGPATARLVVKAHPLDSGLINWRKVVRAASTSAGIADRVDYIDGGALDRLLDGARGVVTVNSTVGLWALLAGRPVVTLGSAIYDVRGLTFDGELDRFWTEASPPDRELLEDFVRALAGTVQIRGVYHRRPGLNAAVASAVDRLAQGLVNSPLNPMPTYSVASQHAD